MIYIIEKLVDLVNNEFNDSKLDLAYVGFNHQSYVFFLGFGHNGEMIELDLATDMSMIASEMDTYEIAKQVKWLCMDAKDKYTNWVFNDG